METPLSRRLRLVIRAFCWSRMFFSPSLPLSLSSSLSYHDTIYPEGFEKYHFKAAIPARNRYLVDNSAYAICYVTHDWGGAAKTNLTLSGDEWEHERPREKQTEKKPSIKERLEQSRKECANQSKAQPHREKPAPER